MCGIEIGNCPQSSEGELAVCEGLQSYGRGNPAIQPGEANVYDNLQSSEGEFIASQSNLGEVIIARARIHWERKSFNPTGIGVWYKSLQSSNGETSAFQLGRMCIPTRENRYNNLQSSEGEI